MVSIPVDKVRALAFLKEGQRCDVSIPVDKVRALVRALESTLIEQVSIPVDKVRARLIRKGVNAGVNGIMFQSPWITFAHDPLRGR